ncbi:MAG TPA: cobalt transporter CbiM [Sumerlaeia bacterium]|nr:cobalt transporter CbiM [Sumerlaeia bacterium]
MHIADGVLSGPVLAATGALAAAGVAVGLRQMDYERVPRVGVLASAFFVASLIHVPIGLASAHLILNGLTGFLLGWAAFPALAAALLLQAILFGYGGLIALGANLVNMALPAVACYYLFARRLRPAWGGRQLFSLGFLAGVMSIALSCVLMALALYLSGREFLAAIVAISLAHVPVAAIEGFVTGSAVAFLQKVRPEFLAAPLRSRCEEEKNGA